MYDRVEMLLENTLFEKMCCVREEIVIHEYCMKIVEIFVVIVCTIKTLLK